MYRITTLLFSKYYGFKYLERTKKSTIFSKYGFCLKFSRLNNVLKELSLSKELTNYKNVDYFVEMDYIQKGIYHGLTMRKYDTDLYNYVVMDKNKVTEMELIQISCRIIKIVIFLHELGYCYLDVKPENFVMESCVSVKLIDYETISKHNSIVDYSSSIESIPIAQQRYLAKYYYDIYGILNTIKFLGVEETKNKSWNDIVIFLKTAKEDDWENEVNHRELKNLLVKFDL